MPIRTTWWFRKEGVSKLSLVPGRPLIALRHVWSVRRAGYACQARVNVKVVMVAMCYNLKRLLYLRGAGTEAYGGAHGARQAGFELRTGVSPME